MKKSATSYRASRTKSSLTKIKNRLTHKTLQDEKHRRIVKVEFSVLRTNRYRMQRKSNEKNHKKDLSQFLSKCWIAAVKNPPELPQINSRKTLQAT